MLADNQSMRLTDHQGQGIFDPCNHSTIAAAAITSQML
jgi:hypothetical protein